MRVTLGLLDLDEEVAGVAAKADLRMAFRHEQSARYSHPTVDRPIIRQLGLHEQPPMIHAQRWTASRHLGSGNAG